MTTNKSAMDRRRLLSLAAAAGIAGVTATLSPGRAMAQPGKEFIAFTGTGTGTGAGAVIRAHLYPDVASAAGHLAARQKAEFFDIAGSRLSPVFDGYGRLLGLRPDGAARPELVFGKLRAVVADVEKSVGSNPEALAMLPRLDGAGDLETAFGVCRPIFGHVSPGGISINHLSNPLHNLLVHGIG